MLMRLSLFPFFLSFTADIISKPSEDVRWEILSSEGLATDHH